MDRDDRLLTLQTIKSYLQELISSLPDELADQARGLAKLTQSLQNHLKLAERHQQQAIADLSLMAETMDMIKTRSTRVSDVSQKLLLVSGLFKQLGITLDVDSEIVAQDSHSEAARRAG